ncbi:MAG: hypothetical protein H6618_06045 [Deltaproteobacteria bacterium]|nr:hypothetical protein [Deltaproteobacteria bacterium]
MTTETAPKELCLSLLCEAFMALQTHEDYEEFLKDLCTPAELHAICGRWMVALMISQKTPYRKICEQTGVSTATITRVAKFMESGYGGYRTALQKISGPDSPTLSPEDKMKGETNGSNIKR